MVYKILFLLVSLIVLGACERNAGGTSKISIQFPEVVKTSNKTIVTMSSTASTEEWSSVVPTGFSGAYPFNCFGVYVSGPEPALRANQCGREGAAAPMKYIGKWKGAVTAGKSVELEVESGKDRVVGIFGFHASDLSACKDLTGTAQMDKALLSKPYFLGEKGQLEFLPAQTLAVPVALSFDSNQWFDECKGPDFQNNGSSPSPSPLPSPNFVDFGNGSDGDFTVTSGLTDVRSFNSPGKSVPLITTSRIESITVNGGNALNLTVGTRATGINTKFAIGDEVALYVAASFGSSACGPNVFTGFRTRGIVQSMATQALTLQVDDSRFATIPNAALTSISYGVSRNFCRLLVTRVPNFNILTFQGSGSAANLSFNATSFGDMAADTDHDAGMIMIRVKDRIVLNSDAGIDVAGRGFSGGNYSLGTTFKDGQGSSGANDIAPTGAAIGSGGAGSVSTPDGPGGGGHGGSGGLGYNPTGAGGGAQDGDQYGCGSVADPQMKCLFGKIFMGGGGGSGSDAAGGNGGGIIYLVAKLVQLNSFNFTLNADGSHSNSGSSMGGGGGAGGTVFVTAESITSSTSSAGLKMRSNGGVSKVSTGTGMGQGGSGGGGRNHLNVVGACALAGGATLALESYAPGSYSAGQGGAGNYGTNYLTGLGIASCGSIAQNQSPYIVRLSPDTMPANSGPFTVYGEGFSGITSASLQNTSTLTEYPCTLGSLSATSFTCTTSAPTAQYHLILTGSTGHKSILNSAIFLSP